MAIKRLVFLAAAILLAGCAYQQQSASSPSTIATQSAITGQYAMASLEAEQVATISAAAQSTAAFQSTVVSLNIQETAVAVSAYATREAVSSIATATAAAQMAELEHELSVLEAERVRQQTEEAWQNMRTKQVVSYSIAIGGLAIAFVVALFAGYSLFVRRPSPVGRVETVGRITEHPTPVKLLPARAGNVVDLPERLPDNLIGLGQTPNRQLWYGFKELGDIRIAGEKGMGKSNMLRLLAYQMYVQGWLLYVIDPEELTFAPSLWGDVGNLDSAGTVLSAVEAEIADRFELYRSLDNQIGVTINDLASYNQHSSIPLPPMALIIDEANLVFSDRDLVTSLGNILVRSRKPGLRVVVAAHLWHSSLVSSMVRYNFGRSIVFKTNSRTSKMLIDIDASQLPNKPGIAVMNDGGRVGMFQTFFMDNQRLERNIRNGRRPVVISGDVPDNSYIDDRELEDAEKLRANGPFSSLSSAGDFLAGYANQASKRRALKAIKHLDEAWAIALVVAEEGD